MGWALSTFGLLWVGFKGLVLMFWCVWVWLFDGLIGMFAGGWGGLI